MATLPVGSIVNISVAWGHQSRLKCPCCTRFLPKADRIECRCGAVYLALPTGYHLVVNADGSTQ